MKKVFKAILNGYLYTNIHMAIGAIALCYESYRLHNQNIDQNYLLFLFFGTLLIYNLHRIIGTRFFLNEIQSKKTDQYKRHNTIMLFFSSLSLIICAILFLSFDTQLQKQLVIPGVLSLFYIIPIVSHGRRLRDLPYLKIFIISICWALLCYQVPVKEYNWLWLFERFCFMMAITIPFDIRDMEIDQKTNVRTLLTILYPLHAKILAIGFLLVSAVISLMLEMLNMGLEASGSYAFIFLVTALLIWNSSTDRSEEYYTGWIDGTLILRGILALIFLA